MDLTTDARTFKQVHELLLVLGFAHGTSEQFQRAYRHHASRTLIALPNRPDHDPLDPVDVISLRRHLVDRGLLSGELFERFLAYGVLPEHGRSAA